MVSADIGRLLDRRRDDSGLNRAVLRRYCGMPVPNPVRICTADMTLEEVVAVGDGAGVHLADDALAVIADSRRVIDEAISRGDAIYGVTTGVGHGRDERVPPEALRAMQPLLIDMHVGAMGDPLPTDRVRAGLVARLNGIARGGAGASLELAQGIAALLNHGINPVIPDRGSVGAGDLGQLAMVGRVLLGRGEVEVAGRRSDALTALTAAGLAPIELQPKDALALISSNALSIGHGALVVRRGRHVLDLADLVAAVSMEATHANPSILDPAVASVRGSDGQQTTSDRIRRALRGSARTAAAASVQDALSTRVVPQVHGACRDVLTTMVDALTRELNAAADNPLVDVASGVAISNGNFHAMNVVLATESLRVALAHVGQLAERRMGHMWDAAVTALSAQGPPSDAGPPTDGFPPVFAGLALRYPAAALYTRLRQLANPVTLDVPTLDLGVEDHAPNTAVAMAACEEAVAVVEELLVIELLIAMVLLGPDAAHDVGSGTGQVLGVVGAELGRLPAGALPDVVHGRVSGVLRRSLPSL